MDRGDPAPHGPLYAVCHGRRAAGRGGQRHSWARSIPERFGVYVGSGIGGMNTFIEQNSTKLNQRGPSRVSPLFIPMMIANMAAGTIAIQYDAQGPCLPAGHRLRHLHPRRRARPIRAIAHGYADAIIAGGAEATINAPGRCGLYQLHGAFAGNRPADAPPCPLTARRAGFVMGEGAGILVLEEYEHAKARGAKIYAEVAGYGNTCDAHHITAPHPDGERRRTGHAAWRCEQAGLHCRQGQPLHQRPRHRHARSTIPPKPLPSRWRWARRTQSAATSASTKSMTGHMLGAAGAVEADRLRPGAPRRRHSPDHRPGAAGPRLRPGLYAPAGAAKRRRTSALSLSLGFGGHNGAWRCAAAEVSV